MAGSELAAFAWPPELFTLTRVVAPVCRSWTKISPTSFESPATRFVALDAKATKPAISADGRLRQWRCPVGLVTCATHTDAGEASLLDVIDKDVVDTVGVAGYQVGSFGRKCHVSSVGAKR